MTWPESHRSADNPRFRFFEDIVRADLAPKETYHVSESYNIGTGTRVSIRQLAELTSPTPMPRSSIPSHARVISNTRLQIFRTVNRILTVSLQEGLERTIEWWQLDATNTKRHNVRNNSL